MANKTTFKSVNSAFAILFMLLIAVSLLHITSASDAVGNTAKAMQMAAELEQFRALERNITGVLDRIQAADANPAAGAAVLEMELAHIEATLQEMGGSAMSIPGMTRLVEPFEHVRDVRRDISAENIGAALESGQPLDRALNASLFVVRNNITRLNDVLSTETASINGSNNRTRNMAMFAGLAAVLVFLPIRIMASRAAARPIQALRAATDALADERWNAAGVTGESDDAVGDLVVAFRTMASKLQESRRQRAGAFHNTLAALVQAIEAKDTFTSNHSCNVAKYAELLARSVGMDDAEVQEVAYGGLLHDIGKIGVPDEIMNKPGKLTDEEFGIIKMHPVIGDRIIAPIEGAEVLHPPVRHHHERWDGTGYPDGLTGEDIPLIARIINVADVFEALTSDRPYRKRMSVEKATRILREESGRTHDPALVDAFLTHVLPQIEAGLTSDADAAAEPADPRSPAADAVALPARNLQPSS